jgi:hypothetical protein
MVADTRTVGTTRPFDGFDKLTAGRLSAPSGVEGLTLAATGAGDWRRQSGALQRNGADW